jgi:CheY-like chemotaxis protein
MIAASDAINAKLKEEGGLPSLYYRISADYGRVEVARSITSPDTDDLFGSTMNICAKINSIAPPNGMVIGSDLYDYFIGTKSPSSSLFDDSDDNGSGYNFKKTGEYSTAGSKNPYSVYSVLVNKNRLDTTITPIHKSLKSYSDHNQLKHQKKESAHSILLVDDEPDTLLTYKTFLLEAASGVSGEDYNVDAFTDSQKALQRFAQVNASYYELVVMDIRMPGLNGLQLYYRIKAMNPNIKILFVSALDAAEEVVSILPGIRVEDIIKKPVDQENFVSKVKAAAVARS